jgi:hypothetical protein
MTALRPPRKTVSTGRKPKAHVSQDKDKDDNNRNIGRILPVTSHAAQESAYRIASSSTQILGHFPAERADPGCYWLSCTTAEDDGIEFR